MTLSIDDKDKPQEEIFGKDTSDKALLFKTYKELVKRTNKSK